MHLKRRLCLEVAAALPLAGLAACASSPRLFGLATQGFSAVVDETYAGPAGATQVDAPHFRTLQQALDAAPARAAQPWRILIRNGRYREKLEVTKPNIHLIGESREHSIVSFDAYAGQPKAPGQGNWTTFGCATMTVRAPGFSARDLTIENGFDYLTNDAKPPSDPTYTNDPQAVAFMLAKGSDRAHIENVNFSGYQDTLFVDAGRSYFRNCRVSGNVDFIFGAGQAIFERCDIVSRPRRKPNVSPHGYVTAPSTQITDRYGLVFLRCKLLRENELVLPNSHALGRPWHPAATFPDGRYADPNAIGSSVFIECYMGEHIANDGWWSMTGLQKSGPTRTVFLPEDSRFFEYKSHGPGALPPANTKRRQLSDDAAREYSLQNIFGDWRPSRG